MDPSHATLFDRMKARMDWLDQRQRILAQNIANSDTPGYRPHDLKAFDFDETIGKGQFAIAMQQTAGNHLASPRSPRQPGEATQRRTYEVAPAGNAVILEEQMAKIGETAIDHKTTTQLYRKYLGLIKTVLSAKG